jgi:hypothetical protein
MATVDPVVAHSGGRSLFRAQDLLELLERVRGSRGSVQV